MTRTPSFSQKLKAGVTKQELMKYYALTETQFDKLLICLARIKQGAVR